MESLKNGVVVIEFPDEILDNFNLNSFLNEQKEYADNSKREYVMGAFGAFGNPS